MTTRLNNILKYIAKHIAVENGTVGDWTYKKYADGTIKEYYNGVPTFPAPDTANGVYRASLSLPLPVNITQLYYANASGNISGRWIGVNFGSSAPTAMSNLVITCSSPQSFSLGYNAGVTAIVVGKYK